VLLRKLIREALERSGLSMAEASRRAGKESGYLKSLLRESNPVQDPGIKSALSVAMALGIKPQDMTDAAMADLANEGSIPKTMQMIAQLGSDLTPAELDELFSQALKIRWRRANKGTQSRND
jgi:lambda repressor-like predicted transcriptional regulator